MDATQVKVLLQEGEYVETLWADPLGNNLYRLDNLPFWAYGISWHDVVEATPAPDGMLTMVRVVTKSGHRTVRARFNPGIDVNVEARATLDRAVAVGCTFEGLHPGYIAIDVPPGVDLTQVATLLSDAGVEWEQADPPSPQVVTDAA